MGSRPAELLTAVVGAVIALLIAFGVHVSDTQTAALLGFVALIPAIVTAYIELTRPKAPTTTIDRG